MEQISGAYYKLDRSGYTRQYAIFYCPCCDREIEKRIDNGIESKSCGCNRSAHKKTHDQCETKLYSVWANMKDRCLNWNNRRYKNYGGRGVSIHNDWFKYEPFMIWSGLNGYAEGLQLNRIDNNGNYEPSNCNFITLADNNRNKTNTKLSFTKADEIRRLYRSGGHTQRKLASMYDVPQGTIWKVLKNIAWPTPTI